MPVIVVARVREARGEHAGAAADVERRSPRRALVER